MSWIILEGVDRSGKSSVSELFASKGFEVVHFKAPDKKFIQPGYAGPSYTDEILELYMSCDGKDIVFDRSVYGELVWPYVYDRNPQISEDDLEILREFEDRNEVQRFLMIDPDKEAHWKRCVDNNEPLNANQFKLASRLYEKLAHEQNFLPRQLGDFDGQKANNRETSSSFEKKESEAQGAPKDNSDADDTTNRPILEKTEETLPERQEKLETANAINQLLSKRIVRSKGPIFDRIEEDIRGFLDKKLSEIFGTQTDQTSFTDHEIQVLKVFCQRLEEKQGRK